jgi:aminopeptidase YwaD
MPASAARQRSSDNNPFSRERLESDWNFLCETLGERLAGTPAEKAAADYIVEQLRAAGVSDARLEPFPCLSLREGRAEVHERRGRTWAPVEAAAVIGAPSTPGRAPLEGELAWIELPEQAALLTPDSLRGKILALFGPMPTELSLHRRILAAAPLALIHVDERLPFSWTKNDGVYPYWAHAHGMLPTLTVSYQEAWRWKRENVSRLRVRVVVHQVDATSHNVIATLPGLDPSLPAIAVGAHHDTQRGNPGADDNASGVICILALARQLAGKKHRRTIRFYSFGTEEQLSVGAAAHVRQSKLTPRDVGLFLNFDSVASPLGHTEMLTVGTDALVRNASRTLAARGLHVAAKAEVSPFGDSFPFNRVGIPSLWFQRSNFPAGRWQHHSRHDTLENVSTSEVQRLLGAVAPLITRLASQPKWPFPSALPIEQTKEARRLGRELFGW